jgi:hypothetical protein
MNMKKLMDIQIEIEQLKMEKNQLVRGELQNENFGGAARNGANRNGQASRNFNGATTQRPSSAEVSVLCVRDFLVCCRFLITTVLKANVLVFGFFELNCDGCKWLWEI